MKPPHDPGFAYRPQLLGLILAGALLAALADPASDRHARLSDALAIGLVAALGYGAMRLCVLALRPLSARWPQLVRGWGLASFYGAIPAAVFALYAGTLACHAAAPSAATLAFVVAGAAAVAAGAAAVLPARTRRGG